MAATKLTKHHLINVPGGFVTLDVYGQEGAGGIPALQRSLSDQLLRQVKIKIRSFYGWRTSIPV